LTEELGAAKARVDTAWKFDRGIRKEGPDCIVPVVVIRCYGIATEWKCVVVARGAKSILK